ncbi:hypothetical protein ATN84_01750 [Paramesorhizobium deserti]|uniref:Uncharacterized protein n=1 Tax=Paramesorhizobium deserti TaxID=1494590 RepID=A0A135HZB4_9HYPH|nr:hypothetical protein [Paramesorhizobium deserti]KXF78542.1 hypothetical protein ATN84_01750 [Paramesorhizobium deserti]
MNRDAVERLIAEEGVPRERVAMAVALARIAHAALESDLELLRAHGATADELAAHRDRRNAEMDEWLNASLRAGMAALDAS